MHEKFSRIQSLNGFDRSTEVAETAETVTGSGTFIFLALIIALLLIAITVLVFYIIRKKKNMREFYNDHVTTEIPDTDDGSGIKIKAASAGRPIAIGSIHGIGSRNYQQDSFGFSDADDIELYKDKGFIAVVADGMGGLSDGDKVSQCVVISMLKGFEENNDEIPMPSLLLKLVNDANEEVNDLLESIGGGRSGSTLTAVIIRENKLSWISVGDSHIYVYRSGKLLKVNKDHNYAAELDEQVRRGMISEEEALSDPQRAALTSYIGMGTPEYIDQNEKPLILEKGDRVLLMSDGVYGTVSDEKICELMGYKLRQSCIMIENEIRHSNKRNQDNYTCVILEITK